LPRISHGARGCRRPCHRVENSGAKTKQTQTKIGKPVSSYDGRTPARTLRYLESLAPLAREAGGVMGILHRRAPRYRAGDEIPGGSPALLDDDRHPQGETGLGGRRQPRAHREIAGELMMVWGRQIRTSLAEGGGRAVYGAHENEAPCDHWHEWERPARHPSRRGPATTALALRYSNRMAPSWTLRRRKLGEGRTSRRARPRRGKRDDGSERAPLTLTSVSAAPGDGGADGKGSAGHRRAHQQHQALRGDGPRRSYSRRSARSSSRRARKPQRRRSRSRLPALRPPGAKLAE